MNHGARVRILVRAQAESTGAGAWWSGRACERQPTAVPLPLALPPPPHPFPILRNQSASPWVGFFFKHLGSTYSDPSRI